LAGCGFFALFLAWPRVHTGVVLGLERRTTFHVSEYGGENGGVRGVFLELAEASFFWVAQEFCLGPGSGFLSKEEE